MFQKEIIRNTERIIKFVLLSFSSLVSLTALICAISLYMNPAAASRNVPYHAYFPSFVPTQIKLLTMSGSVAWNALLIVVHDCIVMALMNHICCQLRILELTLKDLTCENYKQPPLVQLKYCVLHHQLIISLRNQIEGIFSKMLLLQFLTSLFIFGLTGFQATVGSFSTFQFNVYAYCLCILSELFIYCWFANQVIDQVRCKATGFLFFSFLILCFLYFFSLVSSLVFLFDFQLFNHTIPAKTNHLPFLSLFNFYRAIHSDIVHIPAPGMNSERIITKFYK